MTLLWRRISFLRDGSFDKGYLWSFSIPEVANMCLPHSHQTSMHSYTGFLSLMSHTIGLFSTIHRHYKNWNKGPGITSYSRSRSHRVTVCCWWGKYHPTLCSRRYDCHVGVDEITSTEFAATLLFFVVLECCYPL